MSKTQSIMLRHVRCNFPKVFVAEEFNGVKRYSINLMLKEGDENYKKIIAACDAVIEAAYPGKLASMKKKFEGSKTTWPIRSDDYGVSITPKRRDDQGMPLVMDQKKNIISAESGQLYAGCWVNAAVDIFCYTKNGGGVTCYLNGVQKVKDDTPLSGAKTPDQIRDAFDVEDTGDDNADEFA